jgi:hypothetical protein
MIIANHLPVSSFTAPLESKSLSDCSQSGPSRVPHFRRANSRVQSADLIRQSWQSEVGE